MFNLLNKILFKTKQNIEASEKEEVQLFLIQRWCSMYSAELCNLLNQTSNKHWPVLQDGNEWIEYLHCVIPRSKYKHIAYIKKKKSPDEVQKTKADVQKIANNLELSSRELNIYIRDFNLKLPVKTP